MWYIICVVLFFVVCQYLTDNTHNFVLALVPSPVSSIILIRMILPVNNLRTLQMMVVAELSTTNGNPSVSQAKDSSFGRFVSKTFTCIVGSYFCCLGQQRRRPY